MFVQLDFQWYECEHVYWSMEYGNYIFAINKFLNFKVLQNYYECTYRINGQTSFLCTSDDVESAKLFCEDYARDLCS